MDYSLLGIIFRAEGHNSDMWNFVKVHSTKRGYNQVIVGDWA